MTVEGYAVLISGRGQAKTPHPIPRVQNLILGVKTAKKQAWALVYARFQELAVGGSPSQSQDAIAPRPHTQFRVRENQFPKQKKTFGPERT